MREAGVAVTASFCRRSLKGVSEQQRVAAPLRAPDHSSPHPADHVRLGALLDASQPLQEPLCAQPALSGIPVSPSIPPTLTPVDKLSPDHQWKEKY